jgi:Flp pilus assembly protein TadD
MRVLFYCNAYHVSKKLVSWLDCPELAAAGHEFIRCYADPLARHPDVQVDLANDTIHDIVKRTPGGPPDLVLIWEPGWLALPKNIEASPVPVVALLSDWNLTLRPQIGMLDAFDYIFTDRPGVDVIKQLGCNHVAYWPMWGHDPRRFRVMPDEEKIWDITLVGNLNPEIQRERAQWLYRVAKLGERWRVRISGGVYGDDYVRLLNQSKITFNRSIRREFNMRCYEATACGSLLFYEEENEEVRDYFQDRVHCVLYNEHNLEELLNYYLTHDEERETIIKAALARVDEISQPKALLQLLSRIENQSLLQKSSRRAFTGLEPPERCKRHARQVFHSTGHAPLAASLIGEALRARPNDSSLLNDYAVISGHMGEAQKEDFVKANQAARAAMQLAQESIRLNPHSALYHFNLGQIYRYNRRFEEARQELLEALRVLQEGDSGAQDLLELHFPFEHDLFRTNYETLHAACAGDDTSLRLARRCLLMYQVGMSLGEIAEIENNMQLAGQAYQTAASARPDLGKARAALARCLVALGQNDDAKEQYRFAFELDPFFSHDWIDYLDLLIADGDIELARAFIEEHLRVVGSIPELAHVSGALHRQLSRLKEKKNTLPELALA